MIYKIKKLWKNWWFQLALYLIPLVFGLVGYCKYYYVLCNSEYRPWTLFMPLFSTIKLFGFSFDVSAPNNQAGITGYEWYIILLTIARILAVIATGHALFRVFHPLIKQIWSNYRYRVCWKHHEQVLIVGNNEENKLIYRSAEEKDKNIQSMILCPSEEEFMKVYDEGFFCLHKKPEKIIKSLLENKLSNDESRCTIIINTMDEEKNLSLCGIVVDCVRRNLSGTVEEIETLREKKKSSSTQSLIQLEKRIVDKLDRIRVIVFGDKRYETAYRTFEQESFGILRYTNKARKVALDLITRYPLTSFIDHNRFINQYACVNKNFDINVIFIGFGNINQEIFSSSTIINQFIEADDGEIPHPKKINYYLYDKNDIKVGNMNHQIFRYNQEFLNGIKRGMYLKENYLEIPPDPTEYMSCKIDINSLGFYENLWVVCSANKNSLNVISVALGNDLENIELAQRLQDKIQEWELPNTRVFVNVKNKENNRLLDKDENLIPYGCETDIIFSFDRIFSEEMEKMAREKHYMNALVRSGKKKGLQKTVDEIETDSLYEWYTYDAIKKMSSLYSIMSIRSKLQMIGLDYRKKEQKSISLKSNDAYFALYAKDNCPKLDPNYGKVYGKDIYCYQDCLEKKDLVHQSLRQNLAIQEHYRWNAFMISFGFIPSSIEKIVKDKKDHGKDYKLRTHGNLTTVEGLIDFRKLTEDSSKPESYADVFGYDFHLMDDVWWYLNMFEYEIFIR